MRAKFEIVQDDQGRYRFRLLDGEERELLVGLPNSGKIAVQGDVLQTRMAASDTARCVPHVAKDGRHFLVVKDKHGDVIARSCTVADAASLAKLHDLIGGVAGTAPLLDHARA